MERKQVAQEKLDGVTYIGEFWAVCHKSENSRLCSWVTYNSKKRSHLGKKACVSRFSNQWGIVFFSFLPKKRYFNFPNFLGDS